MASTNNDPKVMASYFVDGFLKKLELGPTVIRADRGSENIYVAGAQRYLWQNDEQPLG